MTFFCLLVHLCEYSVGYVYVHSDFMIGSPAWVFPMLCILANTWHCLFHFSHSYEFIVVSYYGFVLILSITNEIENLFMYLWSFEYSQLWSTRSLILSPIFLLG